MTLISSISFSLNNKSILIVGIGSSGTRILNALHLIHSGTIIYDLNETSFLDSIKDKNIILFTGGLGGSTCSLIAHQILKLVKDSNKYTVGVFTKPFTFEGKQRRNTADISHVSLKSLLDLPIIIENDTILPLLDLRASIIEAFHQIDSFIAHMISGVLSAIAFTDDAAHC